MRTNGKIIERPQHLFMRVAVGIHGIDIKDAIEISDEILVLQNGTIKQQGTTESVYKNPKGTYMKMLFDSIR